jgi:hypothetical protein
MTRHPFSLSALAALAAAVLWAFGAGSAAARPQAHAARRHLPVLATGDLTAIVRPHSISYTGDGTGIIGRLPSYSPGVGQRPGYLHWTMWTRTHAEAVGTLWVKSCIPDCAGSPYYRQPVRVTAGRVRDGHFTRLTLYYSYQGQAVVDRRCTRAPDYDSYGEMLDGRCG